MQGWAGRYHSSRRSPLLDLENGILRKPIRIEDSLKQFRKNHRLSQFSGLLLGLSLYSYHVRELLVCWLFFSLVFVSLALVIWGGVIACYAGKYAAHWVRTTASLTPVLASGSVELHLKTISVARKLTWPFTGHHKVSSGHKGTQSPPLLPQTPFAIDAPRV